LRDVWLTDRSPAADNYGSVEIGVGLVATRDAPKDRLGWAIRFIDMMTLRTFTASIPRVDCSDYQPRKTRLVLNKLSQLSECPRVQNGTLLSPNRDPGTDAAQVLQRDTSSSVFSVGNDLLGYDMVNIGSKATLATGKLPEFTTAPASPFTLKFGPQASVPVANSFYGVTGVGSTVRIRSDFGNPKVDSKPFVRFLQGRFFYVAGDSDIPLASMIDQVGLALTLLELFDLAGSGHIPNILPSSESPNIDARFFAEAQYSIIVGNGPSLPKHPLSFFVEFVGVGHLGEYPHRELGIEFESFSGGMVEGLLQGEVGEHLDTPRLSAEPVRAVITPPQGSE
jgi:hypothetical protein